VLSSLLDIHRDDGCQKDSTENLDKRRGDRSFHDSYQRMEDLESSEILEDEERNAHRVPSFLIRFSLSKMLREQHQDREPSKELEDIIKR